MTTLPHAQDSAPQAVASGAPTHPAPARRSRLGARYDSWANRIFVANIVVQAGIVVTGALVRLTGSGLGCPTWPQCTEGSFVPEASQIEGFGKFIEFGNRLLTFVVGIVALAAIAAAIRILPRRRPLIVLSLLCFLGILGQAVIGGITVLTGLNPYSVGAHFLLSIGLIAVAVALQQRAQDPGDGPPVWQVRREVRVAVNGLVALALIVVVLGVVVTGAGPHSGDANVATRMAIDVRTAAWLHADSVILFLGVLVATIVAIRLTDTPAELQRRAWTLLVISLAQGILGYVQFFTGVPEVLVALHIIGACAVWIAALRLLFSMRIREVRIRDAGKPHPVSP